MEHNHYFIKRQPATLLYNMISQSAIINFVAPYNRLIIGTCTLSEPPNAHAMLPRPTTNLFVCISKLLMDSAYLFLNINTLQLSKPPRILCLRVAIIAGRCLLPPRCFLLTYGLSSYTIEKITALACQSLQISCGIIVP